MSRISSFLFVGRSRLFGFGARGAIIVLLAIIALIATPTYWVLRKLREPTPVHFAAEWPSYNGRLDGRRFSPLDQITPRTINRLNEICRVRMDEGGTFESGPLVLADTLYVTTAHYTVALDPTSCKIKWRHLSAPEDDEVFPVNRGVALLNGKLFRGYADGRLEALDSQTGDVVWHDIVGDPTRGEFISAAPLAWNGLVFVGMAGSDWGIKGRVMAYDAETGREVWRFNTIPSGTEPGAESWSNPAAVAHGGGGSWSTDTLDVSSGELFVPVGNPAPDFTDTGRAGENLYTDSMVVLDARTGSLLWFFQLDAHDSHDLDLAAAPMLYYDSKERPMVALASKDGYVYGINRETHQLVFRSPATTIENERAEVTPDGIRACPGALGGAEWNGPAYDAINKSIIVGMVDWCSILRRYEPKFMGGQLYFGGSFDNIGRGRGWITAFDPDTGAARWKYAADAPIVAGMTPTAGGVTFTGDLAGHFLALDSKTGALLRSWNSGGAVAGGVVTYEVADKQYVAFTSGSVSRATFGESGWPTIVIMSIPGRTW